MGRIAAVSAALILMLAEGCATTPDSPAAESPSAMAAGLDEAWAEYVASTRPPELQSGCQPLRLEPNSLQSFRGTVVMLHGYSACPQQFGDLGRLLQEAGWRVLVPVLPGHGRQYGSADTDDYAQLPGMDDGPSRWAAFAAQINGLMAATEGERVLAGYSLGATVSLSLVLQSPGLYDRHLLLAPFFEPALPWLSRPALKTALYMPGLKRIELSSPTEISCWEKRAAGYAGFCRFQVEHVGAILQMADTVWRDMDRTPLPVPTQLIWTEGDRVVSTGRIREFIRAQLPTGILSSCHFGSDVPHQFLSRFDHPGRATPWMTTFEQIAVGFIDAAVRWPATGSESSVDCNTYSR